MEWWKDAIVQIAKTVQVVQRVGGGTKGKIRRQSNSKTTLMVFLVWWANSHSARLHRHYSSWDELRRIAREDIGADWSLLSGRDVYKSYNARMIHSLKNGDFAEVFIQCHQNAVLRVCSIEDLSVTRVFKPLACPYHVMSATFKELLGPAPDTRVQKEFHRTVSACRNSTLS